MNLGLHQLAQNQDILLELLTLSALIIWSWVSHPPSVSQFPQFWNREECRPCFVYGPQDFVLKTWNQFKETLLDKSADISDFFKILNASVLQAAVKVRTTSEFQNGRVLLLFVFLLGSFSGLSCRCYTLNMDSFILFSLIASKTSSHWRQKRWESTLYTSVSGSQTALTLQSEGQQQERQNQNYLVPQPADKTKTNNNNKENPKHNIVLFCFDKLLFIE